jgi:hypothetical protein
MKLTPLQEKGFEIVRKYAHLPLQDRLDIIAGVFGRKTASVKTSPCGGKWRGTSDMSIVFDDGSSLFIGNGRTPEVKKAIVINEYVNNTLARFNPEIVKLIKDKAAADMKRLETADSAIAEEKGLKPYKFLTVELCDGSSQRGGYLGWWYVTLAVDGKVFGFLETGLQYVIAAGTVADSSLKPGRKYYVAGALKETDVDFVFHNVGHVSSSDSYHIAISEDVRKRAEAVLKEVSP